MVSRALCYDYAYFTLYMYMNIRKIFCYLFLGTDTYEENLVDYAQ